VARRAGRRAQFGLTFHAWDAPDVRASRPPSRRSSPDSRRLVVISGATLFGERERIVRLAAQHRLPAIYPFVEYADAGGMLAYAANSPEQWRRAAPTRTGSSERQPAELPVERPTRFDLVVNLQTAQQLGIVVPIRRCHRRPESSSKGAICRGTAPVTYPSLSSDQG